MLWLEKKYLSMVMSNLDKAKWINDNTLNHRCPYCGDSQKNLYKARGYHFVKDQSLIYKCHNCGKSTSSVNFLKENFPMVHKEYVKEWLTESGRKPKKKKLPPSSKFKFTPRYDLLNKSEDLKAIAVPVSENSDARNYLLDRGIPEFKMQGLWFVANASSLSHLHKNYRGRQLGDDPRILLPFFSEDGEMIGLTGRAINDSPLRYLTMRFRDDVPLIFNANNVDKTKTIYVTEGPIDSLFLPNSIAVAGSDFKKLSDQYKENAILIYDNEPRNKEIVKKINEVIDLGYKVCIWSDKRVEDCKDINDMIQSGISESELIDIINDCTTFGLSAKLKLTEYKRV